MDRKVKLKFEDRVVYVPLEEYWKDIADREPEFAESCLEMAGGNVEKAKRVAAWLSEVLNDSKDGSITNKRAVELAKKWGVLDVLIEELVGLFEEKFVIYESNT
ncbi:MAG: hypothetical protein ACXQS2_04310 [Methermicoccaceae archaeon]